MKKVMFLGASNLQVPAIRILKEMGHYVIAVDYNQKAVGFMYSDAKLVVSTLDQEEVYRQALIHKPDVIMTSTSDGPVKTVAYVCDKLGLDSGISYGDALCATNKAYMRLRFQEYNIPIPQFRIVDNLEEFMTAVKSFSEVCVVKPADNAASRGVRLLNTNEGINEIEACFKYSKSYSRSGALLIEEYVEGLEVSVESITVNGNTHIIAITDKQTTLPPFFVEIGHSEQSQLEECVKEQIRRVTVDAINALHINNAPSHTEIKVTKQGPKVIEIAARLGGDFITSKLVPLSTGIKLVENSVFLALNEIDKIDLNRKYDRGAAIRFLFAPKGVIKDVIIGTELEYIEGVKEIQLYKGRGDQSLGLESSNDRIGHVLTSSNTVLDAIKLADYVISQIQIIIK